MSIDTTKGHKDMDYPEHIRTYNSFLQLAKVTIAGRPVTPSSK